MTNDDEYLDDIDADDYHPDDDESNDVRPCPACGAEIYEDSPRCPVCGAYITFAAAHPWSGRPLWWIALAALGVAALILTLIFWAF